MTYFGKLGFFCSYMPLALVDAAGFVPYRILPMGDWPDQAGSLLHDNICPHVKRVLDRALADDLPPLEGVVFVNSCDAMRRLTDMWSKVRPKEKVFSIDLPTVDNERAVDYLTGQFEKLLSTLSQWTGQKIVPQALLESFSRYRKLSQLFLVLSERLQCGTFDGGAARMQMLANQAVIQPVEATLNVLQDVVASKSCHTPDRRIPIFIFGNVMPHPEIFSFFESCGVRVVESDVCTGLRPFSVVIPDDSKNPLRDLSHALLTRALCARTLSPGQPGKMAQDIVAHAKGCAARGVIGHTLKFCDPYLARIPSVREALQAADIPFLLLEGDCTLRSLGQQRTRIEAFAEMIG